MIGTLETWQWAASEHAGPLLDRLRSSPSVRALVRLREEWTPDQIAVCQEILFVRERAGTKFPLNSQTLIADRAGLEMASSSIAAAHKADRFAQVLGGGAEVLDACCGIGGDTMALSASGLAVTAIDLDDRRAWMAGHNARCGSRAADIREVNPPLAGVHIDPARRGTGGRARTPDNFQPPLDHVLAFVRDAELSAIKLQPGIAADTLPPGELEIISESGTLTQAVLWRGAVVGVRRATLLNQAGTHTLTGEPDRSPECAELNAYIATIDPSIERADLIPALLDEINARQVHPGLGLLTAPSPIESPWLTWFRVLDSMPWNRKRVRAALRAMAAGVVAVKTRGKAVDPDTESAYLRGKGSASPTVFILRFEQAVHAIITDRLADLDAQTDTRRGTSGTLGGHRVGGS